MADATAVGGNPLDVALWESPDADAAAVAGLHRRLAIAPFDHDRRRVSVLVDRDEGRLIVTKGAPEQVLERCTDVTDTRPDRPGRRVRRRQPRRGRGHPPGAGLVVDRPRTTSTTCTWSAS